MFAELLNGNEKKDFAYLAKKIILADGKIEAEEQKYLDKLVLELGEIDDSFDVDEITDKVSKLENFKKRAILAELIIIAKCDSNFSEEETQLLKDISFKIKIPESIYCELASWCDKYLAVLAEGNSIIEG